MTSSELAEPHLALAVSGPTLKDFFFVDPNA